MRLCALHGFFLFTGCDEKGQIVTSECVIPPFKINSAIFERENCFLYD
jgi:hypothetical protein